MTKLNDHSVAEQLAGIVGPRNVFSEDLAAYALDGLTPRWAVSPETAAEIGSILTLANREKLAVLPRGNGTKFALGGLPRAGDLVLSLNRFNRIVDYDAPNLTVTVEAGVPMGVLQRTLAADGNWLPLDARFADATIGGVIATNESGPKRLLYGSARDLTLGVRAVLPSGESVRFGGKVMKNVAGYDMTKLLIGSWGTLGVITEMTFRLLPRPEIEKSLLATFATLEQAGKAVSAILASQLVPSALELISPAGWKHVAAAAGAPASAPAGGYILAIDLEGFHEAVERQVLDVTALAQKEGAKDVSILEGEEQGRLWSGLRDTSLAVLGADNWVVGLKISVPISRVEELFRFAEQKAAECKLNCAVLSHAGNGILYPFFGGAAGRITVLVRIVNDLQYAAEEAGGSAIVEWAPWEIKEQVAVWGEPRPEWSLMRRLKAEFDPAGILNPGRFVGGI
jgi:glycolate oxidase FAD binding subunit